MKEGGNTFEAIPFFTRCAALSQEVSDLKKERSRLVLDLSEEEERMIEMQRKIREYREEIQSVKLEAAWSRSKQNQMEVNLLSQHFGGDNRDEIIAQNKRLKSDMQTETLLRQASQDRIREMEMEIDMLKIRVKTAEQEWKDSCKAVDELRKELAMAEVPIVASPDLWWTRYFPAYCIGSTV
jgi:chromosome segregation ATPase